MGVETVGSENCTGFVLADRQPLDFRQALTRQIIQLLQPRALALRIDAVADAPYTERVQEVFKELAVRSRDRHERNRQKSRWYRLTHRSPSLLAIPLDPDDPADFALFNEYAFYSIHAEIRSADCTGPSSTIFEVDDSGLTVWCCLTLVEVSRLQPWLGRHGVDFDEALEPWDR
jgi:hypothetical protein